jgi:AraC family transcriptional regulator, regulatory protein of adaptative response / methylated-DNA-[protein]-cysteine methyltransferase
MTLDFETCWRAMVEKDHSFDGKFVIAVRTTKIYCRIGCPARRPKPENVTFYATCAEARAAGYRACKRCQPDLNELDEIAWVREVCALIDANLGAVWTLDALGLHLNISPGHLQKVFKRVMGVTPRQYVEVQRRERFKTALRTSETVADSIYAAGYNSPSSFHENGGFGMTPVEYKRGGAGVNINYTTIACDLMGWLLIAATERGVCAVRIGDDMTELERELVSEYPAASLHHDKSGLEHYANLVREHIEGKNHDLRLPLDLRASAFQARVWQELQKIPWGSTRSYRQIAEQIGQPTAVRAVARACATNPVALAIPCHRVVGANGDLSGYRWGIARKAALLQNEKENAGS